MPAVDHQASPPHMNVHSTDNAYRGDDTRVQAAYRPSGEAWTTLPATLVRSRYDPSSIMCYTSDDAVERRTHCWPAGEPDHIRKDSSNDINAVDVHAEDVRGCSSLSFEIPSLSCFPAQRSAPQTSIPLPLLPFPPHTHTDSPLHVPEAVDVCVTRSPPSLHPTMFTAALTVPSSPSKTIHPCTQCDKIFLCSAKLQQHLLTHSGDKPFQCFCGHSFNQKTTLKAHSRRHIHEFLSCASIDPQSIEINGFDLLSLVYSGRGSKKRKIDEYEHVLQEYGINIS